MVASVVVRLPGRLLGPTTTGETVADL